jgi:phosphohistidine phosphatase
MNLYFLRHASAGTRRPNPVVDARRPLDKEGKQQCILLGSYLNSLKVQFDLVISSPLKRAQQTASFVGTEVGYEAEILITETLAPGATLRQFEDFLLRLEEPEEGQPELENVLVVGHNPNLAAFLGAMCSTGKASLRMRKGALARVDMSRRPGTLHWLVDPRILRGVYGKVTKRSRRKTSRK